MIPGEGDGSIDLRTYSPLTLAFLGDGVYGLCVRSRLVKMGNTHARVLHERTARTVSATAQAKAYDRLEEGGVLTEEEADIMRRGLNAHVSHQAKNASSLEYHKATGLEALFGYLYLSGAGARIGELIDVCIDEAGI
ncbi:MAG: ribonuclease III [Lachnospiraceae bacterium]|nr:ribonuclease III [Lachnospiraceae bacterium]